MCSYTLIPLLLLIPLSVEISISREGFAPPFVSVANGTTILFRNNDSVAHHPASDPHPTHMDATELEPEKPIAPGSSWTFQPSANKRYRYHDHRFPHLRGEIVVGNPNDRWQALIRRINHLRERITVSFARFTKSKEALPTVAQFRVMNEVEQRRWLPKIATAHGVTKTWQFLLEVYQQEGGDAAHNIAHLFGRLLYQLQGETGITICSPAYAFGCYHGFAEAALTDSLASLRRLAHQCALVGRIGSGPWASCIHGLGHGVATATMTSGLAASLAPCDTLLNGATFCHDGVFMEYAISAPRQALGTGDVATLCEQLPPAVGQPCGRNLPDLLAKWQAASPKMVADLCQRIKDTATQEGCIDAIGLDVAQVTGAYPQKIASGCSLVTQPALFARCMTAAAGELVFQNIAGYAQAAKTVCAMLSAPHEASCLEKVQQLAADYGRPL